VRLVSIVVFGLLAVTVVAEGAYIVKTRRQVDALSDQVQQLAAEAALDDRPAGPDRRERYPASTRPAAAPIPPPHFTPPPAGTTAPSLASPEAQQQIHQMVTAELDRVREEQFARMRERREQDQQHRIDAVVKAMTLSADDGKKLAQILTAAQDARRDLRDKIQSGEVSRADIGAKMAALREETDGQLKQLLGDDGRRRLDEVQRQVGGGGGFGGGGFGPGGFGRRGGPPDPTAPGP
jgi:Na+-transporting NADH:ubiquinone oxidoreductase subunit NqrC